MTLTNATHNMVCCVVSTGTRTKSAPHNFTSTPLPVFNTSRKPPAEVLMMRMCVLLGCRRASQMLAWPGQVTAALSARRWLWLSRVHAMGAA